MGEAQKTAAYVGIALLVGVVAILGHPKQETVRVDQGVGKPLFEKFTDPSKASSLEVVRYAEDVGEVHTFEVAKNQSTGLWSIPSHGNYPADAQDQMKEAATSLSGVTILGVASEDPQDHQLYGVIEPDQEKLKVGDKGIGLLVSFEDAKGDSLARLIIGQPVKGSTEQRFVRIPGQNPVYVANVSTEKLSTKFEDWIEKDLLKVKAFDVERLRLKDYSVVPTVEGYAMQPRSEIAVSFNASDAKWKLDEMVLYKGPEARKSELLEGEELNKEKLDALKSALEDVKIVDVYRKPKGLGATLKASGDFAKDAEARRSLESRGFILDQDNELLSANGELHALTKDGVEYVLRFGNVAGEEEGSTTGKLNRYLFVTARLDESKFPVPELTELPAVDSAEPSAAAPEKPAADPQQPAAAPEKPAAEPQEPATAPEKPSAAPEKPAAASENPDAALEKPSAEPAETDPGSCVVNQDSAAKSDTQEPATEEKPVDPPASDVKPNDEPGKDASQPAKTDEPAAGKTDQPASPAPQATEKKPDTQDLQKKKINAERDRIEKENQRKIDAWKEKKQQAEQTVHELNSRFGDWYYIISEDVYKKLHLSRSDIIKEGAKAAEEGTGVDAFRKLEKEGLEKPEESKDAAAVPTFPNQ